MHHRLFCCKRANRKYVLLIIYTACQALLGIDIQLFRIRNGREGEKEERIKQTMNAFEQIVAGLLRAEGYWTINGYRVNITKQEKKDIGKHSMPRPEIDILAYKGGQDQLLWVECKSYLDSPGVKYSSFSDPSDVGYSRYKVFNDEKYREIVGKALIGQVLDTKLTKPTPNLSYCLIAGKVYSENDRNKLSQLFQEKGWIFLDDIWLKEKLKSASLSQYEDDIAMIVAKIIQRM